MQTDQGRLRISSSLISPAPGEAYLLQVGVPLDRVDSALDRFQRLLLWSVPLGAAAVVVAGRWMAGRALAPLARLAAATRAIGVTNLQQRLPVRGAGDELDEVAQAFNDALAGSNTRSARCGSSAPRWRTSCARRSPCCAARPSWRCDSRRSLEEQRRRLAASSKSSTGWRG